MPYLSINRRQFQSFFSIRETLSDRTAVQSRPAAFSAEKSQNSPPTPQEVGWGKRLPASHRLLIFYELFRDEVAKRHHQTDPLWRDAKAYTKN